FVLSLMGLLFFCTESGFANDFTEYEDITITLTAKQVTLTSILTSIESQSKVSFVYGEAIKKLDTKGTVNFQNAQLDEVLTDLMAIYPIDFKKINQTIAVSLKEVKQAQLKEVKGTITDQDGIPLMGVNVMQKGTSNGVTTDFDGQFSINVPL